MLREIEMLACYTQHHCGDTAAAETFRLTVTMALRQLPGAVLRDLAKRWPHNGTHAERVEVCTRSNGRLDLAIGDQADAVARA